MFSKRQPTKIIDGHLIHLFELFPVFKMIDLKLIQLINMNFLILHEITSYAIKILLSFNQSINLLKRKRDDTNHNE